MIGVVAGHAGDKRNEVQDRCMRSECSFVSGERVLCGGPEIKEEVLQKLVI